MSEQGQEDASDPHINFDEKKLYNLIYNEKFDEAIEFLNDLTLENKTAAVNYKEDGSNYTTLMMAAIRGAPLTLIQQLCEIGRKQFIMAINDLGFTALHLACIRGDPNIDTVKYLVQNGGMELINKQNYQGRTALDLAKRMGDDSIYNFMFNFGLSFEDKRKTHGGNTALHNACHRRDNIDTVKYLVQNGGKELINIQNNDRMTALHFACGSDNIDTVKYLVQNGGKELINIQDNGGNNALHWACIRDNIDIVECLVQNGGTELINKQDNFGMTALDIAKGNEGDSIYNFLKDALESPFHALCSSIDVTASKIQEYLNHHELSCVFQTNHTTKTPLHNLSLNQHAPYDAIALLIKAMLLRKHTVEKTLLEVIMKIAQDPTITDKALSLLLTLVPNLTTALLSYYKRNPAENPEHASRIQKMIVQESKEALEKVTINESKVKLLVQEKISGLSVNILENGQINLENGDSKVQIKLANLRYISVGKIGEENTASETISQFSVGKADKNTPSEFDAANLNLSLVSKDKSLVSGSDALEVHVDGEEDTARDIISPSKFDAANLNLSLMSE